MIAELNSTGNRLQSDNDRAEQLLRLHNIHRTVVVFGSSRTPELSVAQARLAVAEDQCRINNDSEEWQKKKHTAQKTVEQSKYYEMARGLGQRVGRRWDTHGWVTMTGGGGGIMEAINRGASDVGAPTIGLNITLPSEQKPNRYITPELKINFEFFAIRKLHFHKRAIAFVAFPGGFGTFDELFGVLTLIQTGKVPSVPVILVRQAFWEAAFHGQSLVEAQTIDAKDLSLFTYAESDQEVEQILLQRCGVK